MYQRDLVKCKFNNALATPRQCNRYLIFGTQTFGGKIWIIVDGILLSTLLVSFDQASTYTEQKSSYSTLLNRMYGEWTHPCWYLFPLESTLYFPVYGPVLLFLTWLYTRFWLYVLQRHPYCVQHSLSLKTLACYSFCHNIW